MRNPSLEDAEIHDLSQLNPLEKLLVWSESVEGMIRLMELIREGMDRSIKSGTAYIQHLQEGSRAKEGAGTDSLKLQSTWKDAVDRSSHISGMLGYFTDLLRPRNLRMESLETKALFQEAALSFESALKSKNIALEISVNDQARTLHTDKTYLRHAIMNLIDNAIYFIPKGGLIRLVQDASENLLARIEVSDNGPVIPRENADRIFRPFYSTKVVSSVGCGLGLSVTKLLLHRIRGSIAIDPEYRKGARFIIRIPFTWPGRSV
jgi:signal transduction histidine kinase